MCHTLIQEEITAYHRDGFVVLRNCYDLENEVRPFNERLAKSSA